MLNNGALLLTDTDLISNEAGSSGGAIYNRGTGQLTIVGGRVSSNVAGQSGGGITTDAEATARIQASRISNNRADGAGGGGINAFGPVFVAESEISANTAQSVGGGIRASRLAEIVASTISGNRSFADGGGIWTGTSAHILNSTISGNHAELLGGGVYGVGQLDIEHSTLTGNRATATGELAGGGGLYIRGRGEGTAVWLNHSIVAGNLRGATSTSTWDDVVRESVPVITVSARYSLIGNPATAGGLVHGVNGNIIGNGAGGDLNINTVLSTTLADNGGPTLTHSLLANSPAINTGDPAFDPIAFNPPLEFDQRGVSHARVIGDTIDIGAFETVDPLPVDGVITVTTFEDIVAVDGLWSLREAVLWANSHSADNEIVLAAGTYTLTRQGWNEDAALTGDLDITNNSSLRIVGAGQDSTTIDASGLYNAGLGYGDRIFHLLPEAVVSIEAVTLTGGDTEFNPDQGRGGGAIRNEGLLTILTSTLHDNRGGSSGGAIANVMRRRTDDSQLDVQRQLEHEQWRCDRQCQPRSSPDLR